MLTGPQGHVCPTAKAHNVLLRALCEYVDRRMLAHASDTACQVAIMEAHDELCTRAESAEAALRTLLGAHMNVELPADFPIEADIVMLKLLSWRGAGSVQG
jgi:hypothetical protein